MILKQATDYIQFMAKKNGSIQADIDDLKRQTAVLEQQGDTFIQNLYICLVYNLPLCNRIVLGLIVIICMHHILSVVICNFIYLFAVRALEKAKSTGNFAVQSSALCASPTFGSKSNVDLGTDSDSSSSGASLGNRRKRLKKTNS